MKKYIDKAAVVAEIEKRLQETESMQPKFDQFWAGQISAFKGVLKILDTLEVKEVNLEKELSTYLEVVKATDEDIDFVDFAKHFFGLGLVAKDWKKQRMEECPYRQVGCTMYEDKVLECKGACSWVVDYPKLKKLKAQKGEEI